MKNKKNPEAEQGLPSINVLGPLAIATLAGGIALLSQLPEITESDTLPQQIEVSDISETVYIPVTIMEESQKD